MQQERSDIMQTERDDLKKELLHLKNCQLQYFILSITAAGAVSGFAPKSADIGNCVYLAALLVIIPCWWIFFDKGASITRIVGYFRLLEGMIIEERTDPYVYVGWENSLDLFRNSQKNRRDDLPKKARRQAYNADIKRGLYKGLSFHTTHRYWVICWYTFFGLGLTSICLSFPPQDFLQFILWVTFLVLFCVSAIGNLRTLGRLIEGSYSMVENYERWRQILRSDEARGFLGNMFTSV